MNTLLRILCALFVLVGALRAQTWETFELRATAAFAGRNVSVDCGGGSQLISYFSLTSDYASLGSASLDSSASSAIFESNGWTATVESAALQAASSGDHVLWLTFQPPANAGLDVLVPADRTGHALALVQRNGGGPFVLTTLSLGESLDSNWTRGSASFNPALPFWVEDLTTNERTGTGATLLQSWAADSAAYPLESVTFVLNSVEAGGRFTLHYQIPGQSQVYESIVATVNGASGSQQMGGGDWVDVAGTAVVTGSVAVGSDYWLTRDSDGWSSSGEEHLYPWHYTLFAPYPDPLQWRVSTPAPPIPWQTVSFYMATGHSAGASVYQPSGTRSLTFVGDGVVEDFDTNGNPHHFAYEEWTTQIDPREPFWLHVNGTELSQGETWYYNGWEVIGGSHENWQTIYFQIATGYGSSASVGQLGNWQALTSTGESGSIEDYDINGADHSFHYERWSAWLDANQSFTLTAGGNELSSGETWFYNGWSPIGGTQQNQPEWQTVNFQIALGFGSAASLSQDGGALPLDQTWQTDVVPDLDGNGQDHSFPYERWTASVLVGQPFTLAINGTPLPENETWFYNGWSPIGGPAELAISLTLHESRAGHIFTLTSPGGGSWEWTPGDWSGTQTLELTDAWNQAPWQLPVGVFGSSRGFEHNRTTGQWALTDQTTNETTTFDPNGANEYALNLGHWFVDAEGFPIVISLSRWDHDLRIRQRDGEEHSIARVSSQGDVTTLNGSTWYNPYYQFSATGYRRIVAGMDWRVVDYTTGEEAPINEEDLTNWSALMPARNVVAAVSGSVVQVSWQVPEFADPEGNRDGGFYIERKLGAGPWTPFATTDIASVEHPESPEYNPGSFSLVDEGVPLDVQCHYRVAYFYGPRKSEWCPTTTPAMILSDSDFDGMLDSWELLNGLVVGDPDANGNADNDAWTNLEEFLMGTDPQLSTVRITITAPSGAVFVAGQTQP